MMWDAKPNQFLALLTYKFAGVETFPHDFQENSQFQIFTNCSAAHSHRFDSKSSPELLIEEKSDNRVGSNAHPHGNKSFV